LLFYFLFHKYLTIAKTSAPSATETSESATRRQSKYFMFVFLLSFRPKNKTYIVISWFLKTVMILNKKKLRNLINLSPTQFRLSTPNLEKNNQTFTNGIQCPPPYRITLGQHKCDNNNQMIQLTNVFCVL